MDVPPRLVLNPADDSTFTGRAGQLLARACHTPDRLQAGLRVWYPRAIVHRRELSDERPVWYVYRNGRWVAPGEAAMEEQPAR